MIFTVEFRGSPMRQCRSLVEAYQVVHDEYKKRWPHAIWGYQEAAAHGLTVVGKPELTPEEARELRAAMREHGR